MTALNDVIRDVYTQALAVDVTQSFWIVGREWWDAIASKSDTQGRPIVYKDATLVGIPAHVVPGAGKPRLLLVDNDKPVTSRTEIVEQILREHFPCVAELDRVADRIVKAVR